MEGGAISETFGRRDAAAELTWMYLQRVAEIAPPSIRPSSQIPYMPMQRRSDTNCLPRKNPMQIPSSVGKAIEYPAKGAAVVAGLSCARHGMNEGGVLESRADSPSEAV